MKIFIYIKNQKLKMSVIRLLLDKEYSFIEASSMDEVMVKLGLVKDVGLFLEECCDDNQDGYLVNTLKKQEHYSNTPVIWLLPYFRKELVALAENFMVTDLITLPLDEKVFLRKIHTIMKGNNADNKRALPSYTAQFLEYRLDYIKRAVETSSLGSYPISVIRIKVTGIRKCDTPDFIDLLKQCFRQSDCIMDMGSDEYTLLFPYTPKKYLDVLESKIRGALEKIKADNDIEIGMHIYGMEFPEDASTPEELVEKLLEGINQSMALRETWKSVDTIYQKKILSYKDSLSQKRPINHRK